MFIQNIIDFLIIAFAIFMLVRTIMKMQQLKAKQPEPEPEPAAPEPTNEEKLLMEIRDLLKKQ